MATLLQPAKADEPVGTSHFLALSRERGADLNVTVWYPAQAGGEAVTLGDSMLFVGTQAMRDAPIAAGRYPLILLS
ncbi:MAG: dienelactone hydrolase, partial [Mesorhizobium sp.]|nr:dienelactone hydrolase [Mesorhizobium sp.]